MGLPWRVSAQSQVEDTTIQRHHDDAQGLAGDFDAKNDVILPRTKDDAIPQQIAQRGAGRIGTRAKFYLYLRKKGFMQLLRKRVFVATEVFCKLNIVGHYLPHPLVVLVP